MKNIMEKEILPAFGCTEPIALAYAAAVAYTKIGGNITSVNCKASGNIIKNTTSVIIPGTNGLYGMKAAIAAGIVANKPELKMEILSSLDTIKIDELKDLLFKDIISVSICDNLKSLYIEVKIITDKGYSLVKIEDAHDNIVFIEKNGKIIYNKSVKDLVDDSNTIDYDILDLKSIYVYASKTPLKNLEIIEKSIKMNSEICEEGLSKEYGLGVGCFLRTPNSLNTPSNDVMNYTLSRTVAGTDARMAGCKLPAMSNSGSGNQGIATTMPVVSYGEYIKCSNEKVLRAVALSNLVTIYSKKKLGRLSSLCGAVLASAGASCGIIYLLDGNTEQMEKAINNIMGNIAGMFCDGAKAGCSLKISTGTFVAIISAHKALEGKSINGTDGIVEYQVEGTLDNYSRISKHGLKALDGILLDIMVSK